MELQGYIGIGASLFTATSLIPQLVKLCREKKPQELSYGMLIVLFVGLALWVTYGWLKKDWIILISNGCSLALNCAIMLLGVKYDNENCK